MFTLGDVSNCDHTVTTNCFQVILLHLLRSLKDNFSPAKDIVFVFTQ